MKIVKFKKNDSLQSKLTELLHDASVTYYNGGTPVMSDFLFDQTLEELQALERDSGFVYDISPSVMVGAEVVDSLIKSGHEQAALSLDKVKYKNREELESWLGDKMGCLSWKMDGLTVVATYDDGKLVTAVTRGDGYVGSDITHNAIYFHGLPLRISYKGHLVVRGECVMMRDEFNRVNEEAGGAYENPRNLASATIQMLDSRESRKRNIWFFAFELVKPDTDEVNDYEMDTMGGRLYFLTHLGFNVVNSWMCSRKNILDIIELCKRHVAELPYPTDGLVLTYEDQTYAYSLGNTGHHPRGSIAMKWTDETARTTVRKIEWSVGKTGAITPVAVFDTVRLGLGSNVSRASLHNLSVMGDIGIGSEVDVYLSNMIIPQIARGTPSTVEVPKSCPVCGGVTEIRNNNGVKTLHCLNPNCTAKQIKRFATFVSKDGMNIDGLSEAKIEDLINLGYVNDFLDFYTMKDAGTKYLENAEGWGKKSVEKLIAAIEKSRDTNLQHFIFAMSIPLCGHDLSKKLAKLLDNNPYKFIGFIRNPDQNWLENIDGIGMIKAASVCNWCEEQDADEIERLVDELRFKQTETVSGKDLTGLTFVITGSVHRFTNRNAFKKYVEDHGGKVAGSVSNKTSYLVNNDTESTSSKNRKAKEFGVEIISEDEFLRKFGG